MWLTAEKGGGGSMWSKSIHYSCWFQPLICLMWYDILPRWLLVSFIHINEHHQLADWDEFPLSFLVLRQWNLVAIINQGHLSISTRLKQPNQNCALECDINQKGRGVWSKVTPGCCVSQDGCLWFWNGICFFLKNAVGSNIQQQIPDCLYLRPLKRLLQVEKVDLRLSVSLSKEQRVGSMQFLWISDS